MDVGFKVELLLIFWATLRKKVYQETYKLTYFASKTR
jgi:hypothetical protein